MLARICDYSPCEKRSCYLVQYDKTNAPIDVCLDHAGWPVELALAVSPDGCGQMTVWTTSSDPRTKPAGQRPPAPPAPGAVGVPPWAELGRTYRCNPECGYVFTLQHDGTWRKTGKGIDRTIQSWAVLDEQDGDCAAHLERAYGAA